MQTNVLFVFKPVAETGAAVTATGDQDSGELEGACGTTNNVFIICGGEDMDSVRISKCIILTTVYYITVIGPFSLNACCTHVEVTNTIPPYHTRDIEQCFCFSLDVLL